MNASATLDSAVLQGLKGRDFLTVADFSQAEIFAVLDLAAHLKAEKRERVDHTYRMAGKRVAMYFERPSCRTRVSFEVGIVDLGAHPLMIRQDEIQLGKREAIADVARTLSRMVDGIMIRHINHAEVEELAQAADVPVINGLTLLHHPCQILADLLTIREVFGDFRGKKFVFFGDGTNNMARSLMQGCALVGMDCVIASPETYLPDADTLKEARALADKHYGTQIEATTDPKAAIAGAHVVYTDVWVSMGQEADAAAKQRALFEPFQVNDALMAGADPKAMVLHCLPAHRGEEITHEVLERHAATIFEEAENRLHAQKGLMAAIFAD
jgi:ornithine carbamoyltransferase